MMVITSLEKVIENTLIDFAYKINGNILEIGPHFGSKTKYLVKNSNINIIGVDIDKNKSVQVPEELVFVTGDAKKLPFVDKSFDVVVSFDVIEHIDNDKLFLQETLRVLKKDGILFIGTPNRDRLSHKLRQILGKKITYPYELAEGVVHLREYTMQELSTLITNAGFELTEKNYMWLGLIGMGGFKRFPRFLQNYVHYLLVSAKK